MPVREVAQRFKGTSAGTESGSGRMAIIFLLFWNDVQNLGQWSLHKNLETQERSSVDF